jgi:tryptophanyl-tRNA synthetase
VYCRVDPHAKDEEQLAQGGLFPIIEAKLGRSRRLPGTGGPSADGNLLKMSKSLNNAIFLSDDPDVIQKKVMAMYTDPDRLKATDKGRIENNPLWIFHEAFNPDQAWVQEAEARYREGGIGDVECKRKLIDVLVALIGPMRTRRLQYEADLTYVKTLLENGTAKANETASATLNLAKEAMHLRYFDD